jgi:type VI secretion system secreted protein Hcp
MVPIPGDPSASSGADVYLSVRTKRAGDLKGESASPGHEKAIVAHGFQFGVSASSAIGSGQATARRQYKHLVVMKRLDSASTSLMSALATNDEIKELKLALRKPGDGQEDFFTITLAGARVVGVDLDCDENGQTLERATFAFTKIDVEYRVQTGAGGLGASSTFSDEWSANS